MGESELILFKQKSQADHWKSQFPEQSRHTKASPLLPGKRRTKVNRMTDEPKYPLPAYLISDYLHEGPFQQSMKFLNSELKNIPKR